VVQTALMSFLAQYGSSGKIAKFSATEANRLIFAIARNKTTDLLRKNRRTARHLEVVVHEPQSCARPRDQLDEIATFERKLQLQCDEHAEFRIIRDSLKEFLGQNLDVSRKFGMIGRRLNGVLPSEEQRHTAAACKKLAERTVAKLAIALAADPNDPGRD